MDNNDVDKVCKNCIHSRMFGRDDGTGQFWECANPEIVGESVAFQPTGYSVEQGGTCDKWQIQPWKES